MEKDARNFLCRCIGEAESLVLEELGVLKFLALTEQQLLEESERIAMQDRAMSVNKVANSDLQLAMGANQGVNKASKYDKQPASGVQIVTAANEEEAAVEQATGYKQLTTGETYYLQW